MKSVLVSIRPEWCKRIFNGEKTIEVRRNRPKLEPPFTVYVYCTKAKNIREDGLYLLPNDKELYLGCKEKDLGFVCWEGDFRNGKVIGSFVCDRIIEMKYNFCDHPEIGCLPGQDCGDSWWEWNDEDDKTCLTSEELTAYAGGRHTLCGWHITEPKLFDKPRELTEFTLGRGFIAGRFPLTRPPRSWVYVEGGNHE